MRAAISSLFCSRSYLSFKISRYPEARATCSFSRTQHPPIYGHCGWTDLRHGDVHYFLQQPRLNNIVLYCGTLSTSSSECCSNISEIFLRHPIVSSDQLRALISVPKMLTSLFWQRKVSHQSHEIGARVRSPGSWGTCDGFAARYIIPIPSHSSASLERLAITVCSTSDLCSRNRSLMGSLATFT